jgi:DNA mismatch repair protein MutS2
MQSGALRALEFDRIVEAVRGFALTPMGEARVAELAPATEPQTVADLLAATSETVRYLGANTLFPLRAASDLAHVLIALAVEGRPLEPLRLLALADFLDSIEESRAAIRRAAGSFPVLEAVTGAVTSFKRETATVREKIEPSGEVVDDASPELKVVRERLRKQRTRLRGTLESFLRGKETTKYLQEQVVTERSGRYVLVIKAEHRHAIPGIVHGASTSGASLFLEPLSTVEINNDIVALEEQEVEAIRRILLALTETFRGRTVDFHRTVAAATELDVLQARARFSALVDGVEPRLSTDGAFELQAARHPLLLREVTALLGDARPSTGPVLSELVVRQVHPERALILRQAQDERESEGRASRRAQDERRGRADWDAGRAGSDTLAVSSFDKLRTTLSSAEGSSHERRGPVPVTIKIVPPATCLLVTGPNTGGKTVALKTAGLLAMMAQAGLHIPAADGSRLPVFRSLFADIGDEQSIDASLSTFSGHIANIAAMDRHLVTPALVLLDEVGSGTDPIEGGALGVAVIDHFRRRGATVIATSHYDALKTYASTTEEVTGAAFGFDAETFEPTYQLVYGSAGRSLALEIAGRLGLNPSIIVAARQNLSEREAQLADHLAKIDRDMRAVEHEHRLATRERQTLEAAEGRVRQREDALRQREETYRTRLNEELETQVRQARREIDDVIAHLKAKTAAIALEGGRAVSTGDTGAARAEARAAVDAVVKYVMEPADPPPPPASAGAPSIGDRVVVGGLGLEGVVTSLHDGTADLDVRGKRMRASIRDLRVVGGAATTPGRVSVQVQLQPRDGIALDLNVIGCSVDEAIARAERFLDESLLGDQRVVRVIHGYGTGQLKRALAGFLQQHPLVARFATAPPEQGGGGVTVVELKE